MLVLKLMLRMPFWFHVPPETATATGTGEIEQNWLEEVAVSAAAKRAYAFQQKRHPNFDSNYCHLVLKHSCYSCEMSCPLPVKKAQYHILWHLEPRHPPDVECADRKTGLFFAEETLPKLDCKGAEVDC